MWHLPVACFADSGRGETLRIAAPRPARLGPGLLPGGIILQRSRAIGCCMEPAPVASQMTVARRDPGMGCRGLLSGRYTGGRGV